MTRLAVSLVAITLSGAAWAQSTEIRRTESPLGSSTTVTKENLDGSTTTRRSTESTGSVGCETRSVTKTDDEGDSTTKSTTRC